MTPKWYATGIDALPAQHSNSSATYCSQKTILLQLPVYIFVSFASVAIIITRIFFDSNQFADFENYVIIASNINNELSALYFEPFSKLIIWLFTLVFDDSENAIIGCHWLTSLFFIILIIPISRIVPNNWLGLLFFFALYGPLLSTITIRATPAYLLVTYAVLAQKKRPKLSALLVLISPGFHASAFLAIFPFFLNGFLNKNETLNRLNFTKLTGWLIFVLSLLGYVVINQKLINPDTLLFVFEQNNAFDKFVDYVVESGKEWSSLHHIYYFFAVFLFFFSLTLKSRLIVNQRIYILVSMLIFIATYLSPVAAFRQSVFWIAPLIIAIPWRTWISNGLLKIIWIWMCVGIYTFSLRSILI